MEIEHVPFARTADVLRISPSSEIWLKHAPQLTDSRLDIRVRASYIGIWQQRVDELVGCERLTGLGEQNLQKLSCSAPGPGGLRNNLSIDANLECAKRFDLKTAVLLTAHQPPP